MLNMTLLIQLPVSKKGGTDVNVHFAEISDITIFTCVIYATLSLQSSKVAVSVFFREAHFDLLSKLITNVVLVKG